MGQPALDCAGHRDGARDGALLKWRRQCLYFVGTSPRRTIASKMATFGSWQLEKDAAGWIRRDGGWCAGGRLGESGAGAGAAGCVTLERGTVPWRVCKNAQ
eukprot:scaffold118_cov121-Isochrysis_galbana.AAC.2